MSARTKISMTRSETWFLSLFVALLTSGCGGRGEASGAQRSAEDDRSTPVAVVAVAPRDLARSVVVVGAVEPVRTIGVNSLLAGTMLAVHVQEGDRVRAGQLLAELDARETRAQLGRARALLASAEATFERNEQLHASRIITDAEFEQSRSAYGVAKSDAELWSTRVAFTHITAPSAGVVTAKRIEAGSAVSANQRCFDLADVSLLVVRVQISELDVVYVRPGGEVNVAFDAYPGQAVSGRVRRVFPSADPQSRLVPVEIALGSPSAGVIVRPGFLARVAFVFDRREDVLAVPAPAVGVGDDGAFVFVVQSDSVARRSVNLGLTADGWVEIANGLRAGEMVVTSGQANLRTGTRVRVTATSGGVGE